MSTTSTTSTTLVTDDVATAVEPTEDGGGSPPACAHLRRVVDLNNEMSLATSEMQLLLIKSIEEQQVDEAREAEFWRQWRQVLDVMDVKTDEIVVHYSAAAHVAPPELVGAIRTLEESTPLLVAGMVDAADRSDSLDGWMAEFEKLSNDPDFLEATLAAASATLRLDAFTIPECGFQLSN